MNAAVLISMNSALMAGFEIKLVAKIHATYEIIFTKFCFEIVSANTLPFIAWQGSLIYIFIILHSNLTSETQIIEEMKHIHNNNIILVPDTNS